MTVRIAVALYRCEVAGTPTDQLDVQIRHFDGSTSDIESCVQSEPPYSYSNDQGELVTWFFVKVITVEHLRTPEISPALEAYKHYPPVRHDL
jgi:hypothetical protein